MNQIAAPARPSTNDSHSPRLCGTVEGVEFWITRPGRQRLRCLITDAALQSHFGAREFPDSWLYAFLQHRSDIEGRAAAASGRRDDVHVVLVNDSAGQLRISAGRCSS